jgi:hypothetical protein
MSKGYKKIKLESNPPGVFNSVTMSKSEWLELPGLIVLPRRYVNILLEQKDPKILKEIDGDI